jgi:hypothetical protein
MKKANRKALGSEERRRRMRQRMKTRLRKKRLKKAKSRLNPFSLSSATI